MKIFSHQLFIPSLLVFVGCGSVETTQEDVVEERVVLVESVLSSEENNSLNVREEVENSVPQALSYTQKFINESSCDQILDKEFLIICYDKQFKAAKSVAYTLEGDLVNEFNIQDRPRFYEEESIDEHYRAKLIDYRDSGYDRGHLAPDAAFDWSQESLEATYSLANIIPQVPVVNQQMWVDVERYARRKATELGELEVVNVIEYGNSDDTIGEGKVMVSTGYYKILYNQYEGYEACFYYANNRDINSSGDSLLSHYVNCSSIIN